MEQDWKKKSGNGYWGVLHFIYKRVGWYEAKTHWPQDDQYRVCVILLQTVLPLCKVSWLCVFGSVVHNWSGCIFPARNISLCNLLTLPRETSKVLRKNKHWAKNDALRLSLSPLSVHGNQAHIYLSLINKTHPGFCSRISEVNPSISMKHNFCLWDGVYHHQMQ